jgi:stress-induced morphogen
MILVRHNKRHTTQTKRETMANYIHTLQNENETKQTRIDNAIQEMNHFEVYLLSDKFHNDPTVGQQDVLNRLDNIRQQLTAINN